jgi:hypothetical protein
MVSLLSSFFSGGKTPFDFFPMTLFTMLPKAKNVPPPFDLSLLSHDSCLAPMEPHIRVSSNFNDSMKFKSCEDALGLLFV